MLPWMSLHRTLGPRGRRIADVVHSFVGIGVCGILCWYSSLITLNLFQRGVTDVQAVDMPKYLVLMVIPAGFLVLTAQFLRNLATSLRKSMADAQEVMARESASESAIGSPGTIAEERKG